MTNATFAFADVTEKISCFITSEEKSEESRINLGRSKSVKRVATL